MIHIFTHSDFDGLSSAVILASYLQRERPREIEFEAVNYDALAWQTRGLPKNSFVLDFLYNPTAVFHADHHATSMKEIAKVPKTTRIQLLDPERKSCAGYLYEYLKRRKGAVSWDSSVWASLAYWSDIIDSAGYESAEQVVLSKEPALRIRQTLMDRSIDPIDIIKILLRHQGNLELVAQQFSEVWKKREKKVQQAIKGYQKLIKIVNDTAYINLIDTWCPKDRYLPFWLRPDLGYCVTLTGWNGNFQVGLGKNAWREVDNPVNLADLAAEYKGGGHPNAAGVDTKSKMQAIEVGMKTFSALAYRNQRGAAASTTSP